MTIKPRAGHDPVPVRRARKVPSRTRLYLYVQAGGRCEFDGCNQYLLEHPVTGTPGNFAEIAHIYAFSPAGPRADSAVAHGDVHDLGNLMLLCESCHTLVDREPGRYPIAVLRDFKKAHEDRIWELTETHPDRQSTAIVLKALIDRKLVQVTRAQMQSAVSPWYITRDVTAIDLTKLPDYGDAAYWDMATRIIREQVTSVLSRETPVYHLSVFALGPIPLLVYLGSQLTNKIPVELFQRHRDTQDWSWKRDAPFVPITTRQLRAGNDATRLVLLLSLSGPIQPSTLPSELGGVSVYEITLDGVAPSPFFLNARATLVEIRRAYQTFLRTTVERDHPGTREIHLFPAVPAPVAVALGLDLMPRVDPALEVWDRRRTGDGFARTLSVNRRPTNG